MLRSFWSVLNWNEWPHLYLFDKLSIMAINKDIMKLKLDLIILIRYEFSNFLIILYNKTMGCINASEAQTPLNKRNN
jgi:hypothetical protein